MVLPTLPLQFGVPGGMELAVILLIAILLFGANKIPKLARSTGQAMGEFRRGREQVEQELNEMKGEVEEVTEEVEEAASIDEPISTSDSDETK